MIHEIASLIIEKEEKIKLIPTSNKDKFNYEFRKITDEYKEKLQKVIDNNIKTNAII